MIVGFDYETHLLGPQCLVPKPVCLSAYINESEEEVDVPYELDAERCELASRADGDLEELAEFLLPEDGDGPTLVGAHTAFDLAVLCHEHPEFYARVFAALAEGRVHDVQIRERLLNLAEFGEIDELPTPDGGKSRVLYSLASLAMNYLGVDMTPVKDADDAWRTNYDALEDLPIGEWPEEAIDYSVNDAVYPTLIFRLQAERAARLQIQLGINPLDCEPFRCLAHFSLYLMCKEGVLLDKSEHAVIVRELVEALRPEKLSLLVKAGILRPGHGPIAYKSGAKHHVEDCDTSAKRKKCDCPPKMKEGKAPSVNKKVFADFVMKLQDEVGGQLNLRYTDKGALKLDKEFLEDHYTLSPVLEQYKGRQAVQKLVTTDMPRMEWPKGSGVAADVLHTSYDVVKKTGRTSSYAGKLYPSWNSQNPHPRVRDCIVPRPGYYLYSVDYTAMELVTLAQKCYDLFGFSVLRDAINRGWCGHAYLGAQIAYALSDEFMEACEEEGIDDEDKDAIYMAFAKCKASPHEHVRTFYAKYRKFAKPTGLGYPGGLQAETFIEFAHATYKIEVTLAIARELRNVWLSCFPEMKLYLEWVKGSLCDPHHPKNFCYRTPLGLYRANAGYCAAANGIGLQSPGAEGALLAVSGVQEASYSDPESVLYGDNHRALLFVHDEIVGEAKIEVAHEVVLEVSRIMVESMSLITPDVQPRTEGVLMLRWSKAAKPVHDNEGRLIPWVPEPLSQ